MDVILEAIKFNHDPMSATTDAFNIRRNETEFVTVPEWRRGVSLNLENTPAAYAISEVLGNKITIQAKFKSFDNRIKRIEVRAIDADREGKEDWFRFLGSLFSPIPSREGNVLGEVRARWVSFQDTGETDFETFELQDTGVDRAGVRASTTSWQWQFRLRPSEGWIDLGKSHHRIYTVLKMPKLPWQQHPYDGRNIQLPWTEVLDYACRWAHGAQNIDEAATRITHAVYDLGSSLVRYDPASSYADMSFDCASFLNLLRDDKGMGQVLNCEDCATIVSTFANILGCDLWQSQIGNGYTFVTNPIRLIGSDEWEAREFDYHEVAWNGACTKSEELFDGCLQVDGDDDPLNPPHRALLSTQLSFGDPGDRRYRFRLAPPPEGPDRCIPRPEKRQRRIIGLEIETEENSNNKEHSSGIKERYDFDSWMNLPSPQGESVSVREVLCDKRELGRWSLYRIRHLRSPAFVFAFRSLWYLPDGDSEILVRLDVYELKSVEEARNELLRLLARFMENPNVQIPSSLGELVSSGTSARAFLSAVGHYVVEIRSVGRKHVPTNDFSMEVGRVLIN